jgi:hypothetical protein
MAVTIINHQIRSADMGHAAEPGSGGWTVPWFPGRGLTQGGGRHEDRRGGRSDPGRLLACGWLWRCRGCRSRRR